MSGTIKTSELPPTSSLTGTEVFAVVQGGQTKIVTTEVMANFALSADNLGYLNVPINIQTGTYTAILSDSGKALFSPSGSNSYFIPANASVPYESGTVLTFINMSASSLTISINSDTLYLAGLGSTGSRSLTRYGMATAIKMTSTTWIISGTNLV
jgi:hypothetical protein